MHLVNAQDSTIRARVCGWGDPCSHTGILSQVSTCLGSSRGGQQVWGRKLESLKRCWQDFWLNYQLCLNKGTDPYRTNFSVSRTSGWIRTKWNRACFCRQMHSLCRHSVSWCPGLCRPGGQEERAGSWDGTGLSVFRAAHREGSFLFLLLSAAQMPSWNTPEFGIQGPRVFLLKRPAWEKPRVVGSRGSGQVPWPLHLRPCDPMWKFSFLSIIGLCLTSCLFVGFPFFFNWSVAGLQYLFSGVQESDSVIHIYQYIYMWILLHIIFPYGTGYCL